VIALIDYGAGNLRSVYKALLLPESKDLQGPVDAPAD